VIAGGNNLAGAYRAPGCVAAACAAFAALAPEAAAVAAMRELEAEGVLAKRMTPLALSASHAAFDAYVMAEFKRWQEIVSENGVKID
jgi:hypothetical protein